MKKSKENARRIKAMAVGIAAILCMSSVPFHAHAALSKDGSVKAIQIKPSIAPTVISAKEKASISQINLGVDAVNLSAGNVNRDINKVVLAAPAAGAAAKAAQAKYAEFKPLIEGKAIKIELSPARDILADADKIAREQYEELKAFYDPKMNLISGSASQLKEIEAKTGVIDECKDQYKKATAETRNLVEKSDAFEKASVEAVEKRKEADQAIDIGWGSYRELSGNMQDLSESVAAAQAAPTQDAAATAAALEQARTDLTAANDSGDQAAIQAAEEAVNAAQAADDAAQAYATAGSPNAEIYNQLSDAVASGLDQDCAAVSRELETAQADLQNSEIPLYNEVVDDEKKEIIKDAKEQLQDMDKGLADLEEVQKETDELIQKAEKAIADADNSPAGRPADVTDPTVEPSVGYSSIGYDYQVRPGVAGVRTDRQNNGVAGVRKEEKKDSAVKEEKKIEQQTIKKIKDNEIPLAELPADNHEEISILWLWIAMLAGAAAAGAGLTAFHHGKKISYKYKK